MTRSTQALLAALFLAGAAHSDEPVWGQFLGARRDGVSRESGLNLDWKKSPPKTLWKQPIGAGFSSTAVVPPALYTMVNRGERDGVVALDIESGKQIWYVDVAPKYLDMQRHGPGPRATPTYHAGMLYCQFPMGELLCLTATDGKEIWRTNIFTATKTKNPAGEFYYWGLSGSPLVEGDLVIVQPGGDNNNSIAAFHKQTGKLVWTAGNDPPGYSSPIAITASGKRQLVVATGVAVAGLDFATGKVFWRSAIGNPKFNSNCATPLFADGILFYSSAYGGGAVALEVVDGTDGPAVKEKWRHKQMQNQFATSVILEGHVYGCHGDLGAVFLRCVDLKTGAEKWSDRRPGKCSLIAVENHLVCLSENGDLRLIRATPERYEPIAEMRKLLTYKSWAAPALADGRLFLRDDKNLICLDLRSK